METGLTVTPELNLTRSLDAGARDSLGLVAFDVLRWEVWEGGPWRLEKQTWRLAVRFVISQENSLSRVHPQGGP